MVLALKNTGKTGTSADWQWTIEWIKSRLSDTLITGTQKDATPFSTV